ncbi:MAG TPA: transcriptional repressor LexA [Candidatus Onthocola stercorigallinarum]|jgi:repressor LexA|nr:transcriptional repressor LexA [Candidatus Onthocola stercorigallinarum]
MKDILTKRQEEVLTFIKKYSADHGYPPAIREICLGVGLSSPATVFVHVKNLENKGYLKTENNKFRTIELLVDNEYLEKNEDVIKVPLLGKITAGNPITAIEQPDEFFDLPQALIPKNGDCFVLHVSGTSMINKGIYDNDYVIVKRQNTANNGDIVVAMTDEDEVTLKTFYKEQDHIRLQPENDTMAPLIFDNITILGKAIGLYRSI